MVIMSIFCAVIGIVTSYLWWTRDWWGPDTITGTRVGIEDILLGLSNGGIAAVAYEVLLHKRYYRIKSKGKRREVIILVVTMISLMSFLFWVLKLNSFISCVISLMCGFLIIIALRKDLVANAVISGLFMMIISIPVYLICEYVSPGCIQRMWQFKYLSGILVLGIPIEDLIFYFQFGLFIGPLHKLWYGYK